MMTDDLTHYMDATDRMRQRAELAEAERDHLQDDLASVAMAVAGDRTGVIEQDEIVDLVREVVAERDRLRAALKYLRACAHLFPHVNTDRETCEQIGLPDAEDVWCLGCTIGATTPDFDAELMAGTEAESNERSRQWVREYELADDGSEAADG